MDENQMVPESHPLHRLFRGLTESTFMDELGIGDPSLVGYVSNLLADFVRTQPAWRARDHDGQHLLRILEMVAEAESMPDSDRRLACYRRVGDFTLFWTGVFPELLSKLGGIHRKDPVISYQEQGKRSYYLASTLTDSGTQAPVLRRLSDQFELCAFGLSRVRREWEKLEADGYKSGGNVRPVW